MRVNIRERQLHFLLLAILLLLVIFPYVQGSLFNDALLNVFEAVIAVAAILIVGTGWKNLMIGLILGALSLSSGWIPVAAEGSTLYFVGSIASIAFYAFAGLMILRYVLQDSEVTFDTVCGALCVYLLLGFIWAVVYSLIDFSFVGAFTDEQASGGKKTWSELIYLSFMTLTGTGLDTVVPAIPQARSAVLLEAITGVFYMAVMVARLVGLHTSNRRTGKHDSY
jgi:hypothetical protein